jgi:hypothetical protein
MQERNGAFTEAQEKQLERLIKIDNQLGEAIDGSVIKLIDNQGIDRLLDKFSEENKQVVYEIIDLIMEKQLIRLLLGLGSNPGTCCRGFLFTS